MKFGYIYIILNTITNKFYLGSTKDYRKRKTKHFTDLKLNKHHSIHLQRSYNKHGKLNFTFLLIETCFDYLKREQELLNQIDFKDSYNVSKSASGGNLIHNHPDKDILIKNAILRLKNAPKPLPKYASDNPNWRGGIKYYCKCGTRIHKIAKCCIKCHDKSGKNNSFYGKQHSSETKEKLRKMFTGRSNPSCHKAIIINNVEYKSLTECSKLLNIHMSTLCFRLNSKNPKFINYNYK